MRKVLCILMVCILFLLTGCSGNTGNQGGKSGPVTITIWHDKEDAVIAVLQEAVKVLEPDMSELRKQDPRCNKRVDQLIEQVGNLYFNRESTKKELLQKCNGVWQRKKHIYYDEEGIR